MKNSWGRSSPVNYVQLGSYPRDRRGDGREFPWMEEINQLFGRIRLGAKWRREIYRNLPWGSYAPLIRKKQRIENEGKG
jgi:hypothetical protein